LKDIALQRLYQIAQVLMQPNSSRDKALTTALSLSAEFLGVEYAALMTLDEDSGVKQAFSMPASERVWEHLTAQNIIGYVIYSRRVLTVPNLSADERWTSDKWKGAAYSIPVIYNENCWGVYLLVASETNYFNHERIQFIDEVVNTTAAALENWALYDKVKASEASTRRMYDKSQQDHVEQIRRDQMRRDLTAMIYHDLRGPLQNINSSLSGLNRVLAGNDQPVVDELMRVGLQSLRRLSRMVKSLLDLERLEEGRAIMSRKSTKLHSLLSDALELVYPSAREADQTLHLDMGDELPNVSIDPDMILRVLTNLVENAIKHTPTGGRITVRAIIVEKAITISVTDTGPGVPRHFHQEIFDKYFRIKYANAPNGVGLGLAFCRLAVEAHGGKIWVGNDADGGGAVFAFTLPVEQETGVPT